MPDTADELDHILDVLCDDPALLSTPEERGIAAVGYHNIEEAKTALINWKNQAIRAEMLSMVEKIQVNGKVVEWNGLPLIDGKKLKQQVISRYGAEDGQL